MISPDQYKHLYANNALLPLFYDSIKMHKPGAPIRPIVSFCGSNSHKLAQFLTKIFNPLTDLSELKLKNSLQAKEALENIIIPEDHQLVSFDVK